MNGNAINGCCPTPGGNSTDNKVIFGGITGTQNACEQICMDDDQCTSYTWHNAHPFGDQSWANMCYLRHDGIWSVTTPQPGHFTGQKLNDPPTGQYTEDWASVTKHPDPDWFSKAKFGIYAHWGDLKFS
jgi:hypothetical protein